MKNITSTKISLLGLLVIPASAVIAALLPKKSNTKADRDHLLEQGRLMLSSGGVPGGDFTCIAEANPVLQDCHYTATETIPSGPGSGTSSVGQNADFTTNTNTPNNDTGDETTLYDDVD